MFAYLGMMQSERIGSLKTNPVIQGFVTNWREYQFMSISNDAVVGMSLRLRILNERDRKTIYHWIIAMIDTAIKGTPSASPTNPGIIKVRGLTKGSGEGRLMGSCHLSR